MDEFFRTRMGQRFYESTMPKIAEEMERLNRNIKKLFIQTLYGARPKDLEELDRRYRRLPKQLKQTAAWQAASELFVVGEIKRVQRMF